ncbi:hypothetical protein [Anaeromassilibacillus senegalensis]|uniref:hypothetical protein n=1 Tax=Anaeromassilibacillus senegalensis TaxID=1673717 RepID=UPI0006825B0E|nr:hypothetical protein [Anaeromassilibacillus senegalensis]
MRDTYMEPNIQLFAEKPEDGEETKPAGTQEDETEETETGLPKSQEELDQLINERLRRAKKDWAKKIQSKAPEGEPKVQQTSQATDAPPVNLETDAMRMELLQSRAELAAYRANVKSEAVEDAVVLAMRQVEKDGDDLDDETIAEALKNILKRHPEWKKEDEKKQGSGFKVGAGKKDSLGADDDTLSSIFGNVKKLKG